ncbi:hypothetical protein MPNT_70059 [Candidatus Methylacidithermus pantelleriae]|uniref:Uncharacterized protein n=1 Tax=Candidatus Methylacidithermus pantelleriae TaxID=2744239 RepID=A0A8J2FXC5_9BACT|nr:hypothetical protein MPNT_70059 [Candidatus Methylacidithermus pantelleriae]
MNSLMSLYSYWQPLHRLLISRRKDKMVGYDSSDDSNTKLISRSGT